MRWIFHDLRSLAARGLLLLAALMLPLAISAQTTSGSIAGTITDPTQAAVANATVTVKDEAKAFSQTATTDSEGRFVFPTLPPGTYSLSVEATGFKKLQRAGIALVANDKLTLGDLALEIGAATETVTVTGTATTVQAESAERSYAVQGEIVQNIAVNGRGFIALASIAPGIVTTTNTGTAGDITNISANGLRTSANNLQIDGVAAVDTGNNGQMFALSLDMVSEFKILTSNYQAEYGRSAGAQISAVTKSGTREFHGTFYAFRRHDGMNANTWINNRDKVIGPDGKGINNKPRLDQRDIGYTIGGPVWIPKFFNTDKQKLFFFFSQEHQKRLTPPASPTRVTVPTALERAGDFSKSVDNTGAAFPYIRNPELNLPCSASNTSGCFQDGGTLGKIPANKLNALGLAILKIYPLPNVPQGSGFNYETQAPTNDPQRQDLYRGDWNVSNSWRASGKYIFYKRSPTLPYGSFVLASNLPDYPAKFPNNRYSFSTTVTGSLNATTVLEVTFGQTHNSIDILPANSKFNRAGLGLSALPVLYPGAIQIDSPPQFTFGGRIANGPNIGSNNAPFYNFNTTRDWSVNLSKIAGAHNLKVGWFWQNSFKPQSSFAANNGIYNFSNDPSNPFDTGFGFANAAIGVYNTFQQASGYFIGKYRYNNVEWFAQDNWKVNSRLTLDYGMRFYWIQPQYDEDLQTANFLPGRFNRANAPQLLRPGFDGSGNRVAVNPLTGAFLPTAYIGRLAEPKVTNGVVQAGAGIERGLYRNRGVHFAPRFGFGYDVFGNQKMVVRGGGGIFYDRPQGNTVFDLVRNPPTTLEPTFFYGRFSDISSSGQVLLAPPGLIVIDRKGQVPTTYSFNLGVQYKLPLDSVLDVSYVGTVGSHLLQRRNINAPNYGTAYLKENQDPTRYAGGIVPDVEPNLPAAYAAKGLKFTGQFALPVDFLRPFPGFGNIQYIEPASSSNYHSMQASVNRRFSKGLLLGVNYTWGKAMGTQANDLPGVAGFGAPHILDNRRANYAPQDFDRRHNFNVNWVWDLPRATGNGLLGYALNGWQLSGIYRYVTGQPYNIGTNIAGVSAYALTGTQQLEGARIVLLKNPGSGNSSDPYRQFDVSAFALPTPGSMSFESGRNFLHRPPINNWDISLSKEFQIKEKAKVEFRLDAFNAFNHTQFDGANTTFAGALGATTPTNLASPNVLVRSNGTIDRSPLTGFGAITSVRPPRNLQLSARFQF